MNSESVIALVVLCLLLVATVFWVAFWPRVRRKRITSIPFPDSWRQIVCRRLPFFVKLPAELQRRFEDQIKVFVYDKSFVGCAGQDIDDEVRVTIAAQACLLILNRDVNPYLKLDSVLVYPSTFVATRQVRDELGLVSVSQTAMLGESWSQGKVILAWDNVEEGARSFKDGQNVVLHEFAHQLDNESGSHNGAPVLATSGAYQSWAHVLTGEFEQLQKKAARGRRGLIDHYGATNPAEFFAVTTETFFERPEEMFKSHRELFDELAGFYRLDPRNWHDPLRGHG
ncbi:MAG: zinc-dependent peptidase [Pseudohongiellaceae bacterium]